MRRRFGLTGSPWAALDEWRAIAAAWLLLLVDGRDEAGAARIRGRASPGHRLRTVAVAFVAAACGLALAARSASAASFTWSGAEKLVGPNSVNWSNGANWGGTAPSGTVGTLTFPALASPPTASAATSGSISGKVTSASAGGAIEGTLVCASPNIGGIGRCANTDSKGEYTIVELGSGEYIVEFTGEKCPPLGGECKHVYVTQYYNGKSSRTQANPVTVTAGKTTEGINASLAEGGSISGKVTSASNGAAIEGTFACASPSKGGFGGACAQTTSKGEYTIGGLASGEYIVEFNGEQCPPLGGQCKKVYITQYYNGKSSRTEANPVTVTAGKTTEGINASLTEGGSISGKVTSASGGGAIEGTSVCASASKVGFGGACAQTTSKGEYTIGGLASGEYIVEFNGEKCPPLGGECKHVYVTQYYNGKSSRTEANPVIVTAAKTTEGINASLAEGGSISGKVTSASGGGAIEGTFACASPSKVGFGGACAQTDSKGEYTIGGLASGEYIVEFNGEKCPPLGGECKRVYATQYYNGKSSRTEANPVTVTAGKTTEGIDASLAEGGSISGKVTSASGGGAIEGTSVCVSLSKGGFGGCATTNSKGEYTIGGLASGEYVVEFNGEKCPPLGGECKKVYVTQYYNGKSSRTEANPVAVTAGKTTAGTDAALQSFKETQKEKEEREAKEKEEREAKERAEREAKETAEREAKETAEREVKAKAEAEAAAKKKAEEEAAAKKHAEEEAAAKKHQEEAAAKNAGSPPPQPVTGAQQGVKAHKTCKKPGKKAGKKHAACKRATHKKKAKKHKHH